MQWSYKIYANGSDIAFGVRVISKSEQQTGLAHAGVANEQQLKEEIAANIESQRVKI